MQAPQPSGSHGKQGAPAAAWDSARLGAAFAFVRALAFVLVNGVAYGVRHKIVAQAVKDAFATLAAYQERHGELTLTLVDGVFLVNGQAAEKPVANGQALAKRLHDLEAHSLTFAPGMTFAELEQLASSLFMTQRSLQEAGGFQSLLRAAGATHISSDTYTYKRVGRHEAVVAVGDKAGAALEAELTDAICALLDGSDAGGNKSLSSVALDREEVVRTLAALAQPAEMPEGADGSSRMRETLLRLRRLCDGLLDNPANRTQKGRRALKRLVQAVERDLAAQLAQAGEAAAATEWAAGIKDLQTELAVDGLVARYVRQRRDIDASEGILLRQMERSLRNPAEAEELHSRLLAAGLPEEAWEALLARRGGRPKAGGVALPGGALERLNAAVADGLPEVARSALGDLSRELLQAQKRAEEAIAALAAIAKSPAQKREEAEYTRRRLLALMAELGQEMRQPLTVINAVLEMAQSQRLGRVDEEHLPLLKMAVESGRRLDTMIVRMVEVSGMPLTLQPDRQIIESFS